MKKYLFFLSTLFSFFTCFSEVSQAITITASPSPASVNQPVTVTVTSSYSVFAAPPNCTIEVNFGDGAAWTSLPLCTSNSCTRIITHAYATPGQYTITARGSGACIPSPLPPDPATAALTVQCTPLTVTSPSGLPQGTVNTAYSYQILAAGGMTPYTYVISGGSLPPGLTLGTSGLISGIPATAGNYNFTVTAADACAVGTQTAQKTFTMTINPAACPPLSITSSSILPSGTAGLAYSHQILTIGGQPSVSFALTAGSFPPGISMAASGLISGTSTAIGNYNFSITAADACATGTQTTQKAFTMTINPAACPPLNITSSSVLPSGTAGLAYSHQILTTGGQPPVSFALAAGSFPPGVSMAASGLISGTPTAIGSYNFTITATDACAAGTQTARSNFTVSINPAPCSPLGFTSSSILPPGTAGKVYTHQILTTGGQPPVVFRLAAGSLPKGLNLETSGRISGTPMAAGTYHFTIAAEDACAAGVQQIRSSFSIVIGGDVQVTASPSSSMIARNMAWTQNIFYTFSDASTAAVTLTSGRGVFTANNQVIGEINRPLNVAIANGVGNVSEVLNVPVAISERARQADTSRIIYTRTFTDGTLSATAQIEIIIGTGAASEFTVTRLQLYFENRRAEITVNRNQPFLKAFADIRFSGSGLLTGYWEVDGRILDYVNQHLVYGESITLASPEVPPLPTFSPGTHIVKLVISTPSADIPVPQAIYFVTAEESGDVRSIDLTLPENNAGIMYSPVLFEWQSVKWADTYLIAFFGETDDKPIFSAYTRDNSYRLPPLILNRLFTPNGTYQWRVRGYDENGNTRGESALFRFFFSE